MSNAIERALWTGVQAGLAILTVDGLVGLDLEAQNMLITAGIAAALSALKTLSVERTVALQNAE